MTKQASDHAISVFKAGLSAVPVVGGAIASLIGDYVPSATERSIVLAIEELEQYVRSLGDRVNPDTVNKEQFSELFKSCYLVIIRTHQQEKRSAAVRLIANILLQEGDPILILTAKGNEVDKVLGLRLGADDYVTKPFGLMELMARVEALLRRVNSVTRSGKNVYQFGSVELQTASRRVLKDGREVILTPKEYGLLLALIEKDGAVASRIDLMSEVWGHSSAVISRTVDTHIAELRRKLEVDPARPRYIITVRKTGYRFTPDMSG